MFIESWSFKKSAVMCNPLLSHDYDAMLQNREKETPC